MRKKSVGITLLLLAALLLVIGAARIYDPPFERLVNQNTNAMVNLCYKDADGPDGIPGNEDDWQCEKNRPYTNNYIEGFIREEIVNFGHVEVWGRFEGLKPDTYYQLKLNSYGPGFEADAFANACGTPNTYVNCMGVQCWKCGYWGGEGFLVLDILKTDSRGRINIRPNIQYPLPEGVYRSKLLLTENGGSWDTPLMEMQGLQFIVLE